MTFRHSDDMIEISGFGGGYEKCCQDMLEAGVNWLNAHPDCKLSFSSYEGVYGLFNSDSDDAKALEQVVLDASLDPETGRKEATGGMMHAVMERLWFIKNNGWDEYCRRLREAFQHEQEVSEG